MFIKFIFEQNAGDDKLEKIFSRFESLMPRVNETKLVTDMLWKSYEVFNSILKKCLAQYITYLTIAVHG